MKTFEFESSETRDPDWESVEALVDGTLGDQERSALLLHLDVEPGGWRRCALAFLEDQAIRAAIVESTGSIRKQDWPTVLQPTSTATRPRFAPLAALAASLIVAFGLGWALPRPFQPQIGQPATIAKNPPAATPATRAVPPKSSVEHRAPVRGVPLRAERSESTRRDDSPLSQDALARLARDGFAVEMRSGLAAIVAPGIDPLPVPVAEVQLHYVGNRIY